MMRYRYPIRFSRPYVRWCEKDRKALEKIMDSGWLSNWEYVRRLEETVRTTLGVPHAIACSSATQGLMLAVRACGWNRLRVLLPAFTWPSTLFALEMNNCTPVFGDIDPETWLLDANSARGRYDGVLAVDVFGNQAVCPRGVPTIVDAAHGYGLPGLGKRGIVEVVSLSHTKIPTAGEGSVILVRDRKLAKELTEYRRLASRMPETSAVIALQSIRRYRMLQKQRRSIIRSYRNRLRFPYRTQKVRSASTQSVFAVRVGSRAVRERMREALKRIGVEPKVYYEPLVPGLPETDRLFDRILALPVYPGVRSHIPAIAGALNRAAGD